MLLQVPIGELALNTDVYVDARSRKEMKTFDETVPERIPLGKAAFVLVGLLVLAASAHCCFHVGGRSESDTGRRPVRN